MSLDSQLASAITLTCQTGNLDHGRNLEHRKDFGIQDVILSLELELNCSGGSHMRNLW